jgi:hypothetical protein
MASCDTEFDFDCPRFAYELSTLNSISDSEISYIDPWFLRYHADHDREVQTSSEAEKERSSYGRPTASGAAKCSTSHLGPVRISRHLSSAVTSTAHFSFPSGRRGSQKGDESKVNDMKNHVVGKVPRLSSGTKRRLNSDQSIESIETATTSEAPVTDMRDKLDEFRQRKKRDNGSDHTFVPPIVKTAIPPTDYSRSKLVLSAPSTAPVNGGDISNAKSLLANAKKLSTSAHSTSFRVDKRAIPAVSKTVVASSKSFPQKHAAQNVTNSTTDRSSSSSSSSKHLNIRKPANARPGAVDDNASMMELLKKHNQRFAPIPIYEPPRHSVRDVRQWEKMSGKTWLSLKPEEREVVNAEISKIKEAAKKEAGR